MASALNVILIEDHRALREELTVFLSRAGHKVIAMPDAETLMAENAEADLFIIDIGLPGEDGITLARWVRSRSPSAQIFILTANDDNFNRVESYGFGVDLFLKKPIEPRALLQAVQSVVPLHMKINPVFIFKRSLNELAGKDGKVRLSSAEAALLQSMLVREQKTLTADEVGATLNIVANAQNTSSLEARISILRKKIVSIGGSRNDIAAVRSHGYKLNCDIRIED